MSSPLSQLCLVLSLVGMLVLLSPAARGEGPPLAVIPTGTGPALGPTVAAARAVAAQLTAEKKYAARLAYLAPPARPDKAGKVKEKNAERWFKRLRTAYEFMEYDKVLKYADETLKALRALLAAGQESDDYVRALHFCAAAALLEGDETAAAQFMNDAVLFDPRAPSAKLFNPSVQELYRRVRTQKPAMGTVEVSTSPPALIWFNGRLHGLAEGKVTLPAGTYLVRGYLPGYASVFRWLKVTAGEEQSFSTSLPEDASSVEETIPKLREEATGSEPGATINQAGLDLGVRQLILITAGADCSSDRCPMELHWVKKAKWARRTKATYTGRADRVAALLLGLSLETPSSGPTLAGGAGGTCTADSQCAAKHRCTDGRCTEIKPLTRTWWFWSLVGVATVGATLAIVLPLTSGERPVIEVR